MAIAEYTQFDATRLAELIKKKEITPQEALEAALDRCADVNPKLNAVVGTYPERAARTIEAGVPDGPFSGVPFLLKDQIALEGTRLTLGSDGAHGARCRWWRLDSDTRRQLWGVWPQAESRQKSRGSG